MYSLIHTANWQILFEYERKNAILFVKKTLLTEVMLSQNEKHHIKITKWPSRNWFYTKWMWIQLNKLYGVVCRVSATIEFISLRRNKFHLTIEFCIPLCELEMVELVTADKCSARHNFKGRKKNGQWWNRIKSITCSIWITLIASMCLDKNWSICPFDAYLLLRQC